MDAKIAGALEEIVSLSGDFYRAATCDFLNSLDPPQALLNLSTNQISSLKKVFEQPLQSQAKRYESMHAFISGQRQKEERHGGEKRWRSLFAAADSELESDQFSEFVFKQAQDFNEKLKQAVSKLAEMRSRTNSHAGVLTQSLIYEYLDQAAKEGSKIHKWQREVLQPLVSEKLFYTFIDLHRLQQPDEYRDRKETLC
ncbi:MAG: hypothetical protein ACE5IR_12900 [bacterium]